MREIRRFGPIAMLAVGLLTAPAFAGNVTVGLFYTAVAQTKQLESTDGALAEASLRRAGFDLPQLALDKGLTEADMTSISRALGVPVTTHRPSQPVSASQVETYFSVFATRLRPPAAGIGAPASIDADDQDDNNDDQGPGGPPHSKHKP
jgi:hypothetical protein